MTMPALFALFGMFGGGSHGNGGQPDPRGELKGQGLPKAEVSEGNTFQISLNLHENFKLCRERLTAISIKLCASVHVQTVPAVALLSTLNDGERLNSQDRMQLDDLTRQAGLLQQVVKAVGLLDDLLEDSSVVGNPHHRKVGECPVQLLIRRLREIAEDPQAGLVGCGIATNDIEHVDASLRTLFRVHSDELAQLMKVPEP